MAPKPSELARAVALLHRGDAEAAIPLLRGVARLRSDPETNYWLGEALVAAARPAEAIEPLKRATAAAPDDGRVRLALVRALARSGDRNAATAAAADAMRRLGRTVEFCLALTGAVRQEIGSPEAVAGTARQAFERHPGDPRLETLLAGALSEAGSHGEAVALFERLLARAPGEPLPLYNLANALKRAGRADAAERRYLQALAVDPGLAAALGNLGNLYLDLGRVEEALAMLRRRHLVRRRERPDPRDTSFTTATPEKLLHDADQFERLVSQGLLDESFLNAATIYRRIAGEWAEAKPRRFTLTAAAIGAIGKLYNRIHHLADGEALPGSAVSPGLDWAEAERRYASSGPGIVWIDDFLTPAALARLRAYCLDSTVWHGFGYANRYLGSMVEDGFATPMVAQIATELKAKLPTVIGKHHLRKAWGFKYDLQTPGIRMHADFAAVNVNFWITPDISNRSPGTGGLLIHPVEAPKEWDFATFNSDNLRIDTFLRQSAASPVRVPYRQNRAVIFNSNLFHKTDDVTFGPGFADRRINITLLYGRRDGAAAA